MTKRAILLLLCLLLPISNLGAIHNDSSQIIPINNLNAGIHLGLSTTPGPQTYLSTGIGINEWSDLRLRLGYADFAKQTNSLFAGLYYKVLITRFFQQVDSVSFELGTQYHQYFSVYNALVVTTGWKFLQFYTGLDDSVYFTPSGALLKMQFLLGVKAKYDLAFLGINKIFPTLNFEVAIPCVNRTPYVFSLSAQYTFEYKTVKRTDLQ